DLSPTFGAGAEKVTLEISNFSCTAPAGTTQLVMPNCTSWQIPGGTLQCVASAPDTYPINGPGGTPTAVPGSPSKCTCGIIALPLTVQTPTVTVAKTCTTAQTPTPGTLCTETEGGPVLYTVAVTNTSNFGSVVVDQICDSAYGDIFTAPGFTPTCAA